MTLKIEAFDIDDADKEVGIAAARAAYNAALPEGAPTIDSDVAYANMIAPTVFDAYIGSAKRAVAAKLDQLWDAAAIAEVATLVDQKIAEKGAEVAPAEPPVEVPVGP